MDCETGVILDIDYSMMQPHDTQIGWQVLTRNLDQLEIVVVNNGYDLDALRQKLREGDVQPIIKDREFCLLDMAHNARHDDESYHRRLSIEGVFFVLRHRFSETLRVRTWFVGFRELVVEGPCGT